MLIVFLLNFSRAQTALKEANDNEEQFEITVQGWLALGRAYLAMQRSNDMFDKDQCKYAFEKVNVED